MSNAGVLLICMVVPRVWLGPPGSLQVYWREQTGLEPLEGSWQLTSPLGTVLEVLLSGISWVGRTVLSHLRSVPCLAGSAV